MNPVDIIYQLKLLGKTQAQLARDLEISNGVVNNVIHGKVTSYPVARHIALLIGKDVNEIWPD